MLRINLIPPSYYERKRIKRLITVMGAVFGLVVLGMLAFALILSSRITHTNEELARVTPIAQEVEQLEAEASSERASVGPIRQKVEFIEATMEYNTYMIPLLLELNRYTFHKITYTSVSLSDDRSTLNIQGWAPGMVDAGRYLMGLYRAKHLFSSISFSGVPGYRTGAQAGADVGAIQGAQLGFNFTVNARLVTPPATPAAPGAPALGAEPGMDPGMGLPPMDDMAPPAPDAGADMGDI